MRIAELINGADPDDLHVAEVCGLDLEYVEELPVDTWLYHLQQPLQQIKEFEFLGGVFKQKDWRKFSLGEFIDANYYYKHSMWLQLVCVFFRQYTPAKGLTPSKLEDYTFCMEYRAELAKEWNWRLVDQCQHLVNEMNTQVNRNFKIVFEDDEKEQNVEEIEDARVAAQIQHAQKMKAAYSEHAWEYTVMALAEQDILKTDGVLAQPLFKVLNFLQLQKLMEIRRRNNGNR